MTIRFRAPSVEAIVNEIESSFAETDRLRRTEMICADIDPDDIDAHMEAERIGRRVALRECIVEGCGRSRQRGCPMPLASAEYVDSVCGAGCESVTGR